MRTPKISLSEPEIKLGFQGKRGDSFSITCLCFGLDGAGIPMERYREVRARAKELATTHPSWPIGAEPSDEVIWEGDAGLFTIKPLTKGGKNV